MRIYLIHCGFYDEEISQGVYEFHVNIPVAAESLEEAKAKVRLDPVFRKKKMHIDGIQELSAVSGFAIQVAGIAGVPGETQLTPHLHRDF